MGAEISTEEDFETFQKRFVFQKQFDCPNYGEIKLMKHPETEQYIAIKVKLQQGVLDPKNIEEKALEQKKMKHENLVECLNIFFRNHEELCSRFIKMHMVYEYLPKTLAHELESRSLTSQFFQENEVISLINSVVSALFFLKSYKKNHGDINPKHILITKDGRFKLTDIEYLTEFDEYKRFFAGLGETCYLSPLLFRALGHRMLNPIHNPEKSCVFSLGMVVMQLGLLEFPQDIYNFDSFEINEKVLKNLFNKKALGLYSERLQRTIWRMLELDENERIDYDGIFRELEAIRNNASVIYDRDSAVFERSSVERPKKAGIAVSQRILPSPARPLERETLFDFEEEVMLNIPNNLDKLYEKMFKK